MRENKRKNKFFKFGSLGLVLATLFTVPILGLTGCSDNPPTSTNVTVQDEGSFFDNTFDPATLDQGGEANGLVLSSSNFEIYRGEGLVSASTGGSINLPLPGDVHSFIVEPESIPSDTIIDANVFVWNTKRNSIILFGFGPDGLHFNHSAELTFDIEALSSNTNFVNLYWWNPETFRWEFQETATADKDGIVSFKIDHFSMYGVE